MNRELQNPLEVCRENARVRKRPEGALVSFKAPPLQATPIENG